MSIPRSSSTATTLTLTDLGVAHGARPLFTGLDLTLTDGDVTAVVGPNGSGKSTLMRTVVGDLPVESGTVRLAPAVATVAWLPQAVPDPVESLLGYARRRTGVASATRELESSAAALAGEEADSVDRYAVALDRWLALGAADLDERLPEVAARVGLEVDPARPLGSLSGGEAARAALVTVLLSRHDVLLLDEPTNDLDARGLALVTEFVRDHAGPVLLASHDRSFLDAVATSVVELDLPQQRIRHHPGGWTAFRAHRDLTRAQEHEAWEGYAAERDALLAQSRQRHEWADRGRSNVARGGEPDKHLRERHRARADRQAAKGARLERAVDRLEVAPQPRKEWQLRYAIAAGRPSADVVATLEAAVVHRGDFRLGPVSLAVGRGDRVAARRGQRQRQDHPAAWPSRGAPPRRRTAVDGDAGVARRPRPAAVTARHRCPRARRGAGVPGGPVQRRRALGARAGAGAAREVRSRRRPRRAAGADPVDG